MPAYLGEKRLFHFEQPFILLHTKSRIFVKDLSFLWVITTCKEPVDIHLFLNRLMIKESFNLLGFLHIK